MHRTVGDFSNSNALHTLGSASPTKAAGLNAYPHPNVPAPRGRHLRRAWTLALLALIPLGFLRGVCAQSVVDESRLKAAFLYRFAQFVEWPAAATTSTSTVNLCVTGPGGSRDFLEELVAGETIGGRPLAVHEATSGNVTDCHLLFLHADDAPRRALLRRVSDRPVLTVSDAPRFLDQGGIVLLHVVDNRVRFEIDAEAARRANLRLNTQLLKLATNVRGGATR